MSERDPLLALRGLIDEPIAPRSAFADELRARLLTELGSHRRPAIDEERTMEITTPGLHLVLPGEQARQLPSWRRIAEIAALIVLVFGVIAVFASERANSPSNPPPTSQGNLGVYPPSFATPEPGTVTENEANVGVLWKVPTYGRNSPLIEVKVYGGVAYFLDQFGIVSAVDVGSGDLLWKADAGIGWGISVDDSGVYVTARINEPDIESRLIKLDLATGNEDWHVSLGPDVASQPILKDGVAYVWDGQNYLYAVETATGRELWRRHSMDTPEDYVDLSSYDQHGSYRPDALLEGDNLFVVTSDGKLGRIGLSDAKSGAWAWITQLESSGARQYFLAATSDTVAAVSIPTGEIETLAGQQTRIADPGNGSLVVIDSASGDELWQTDADDAAGTLVANGNTYVVSITPGSIPSTPIGSGLEASYYESRNYDARTGAIQWTVPFFIPWAITPDGSTVVSFTGDGFITLVDTVTGNVLGSAYTFGTIYGGFTVTDEALFGYRSDDVLVGVDLDTLKNGRLQGGETPQGTPEAIQSPEVDSALLWQTEPEGEVRDVGKEVISNNTIFRLIATGDFQGVEAFDTTNGELLWRQAVVGDDLVADENGVYVTTETYANPAMTIPATPDPMVFGPTDASIVALDPATGDELWTTDTGTGEAYPTLRDGTLYVLESEWAFNVPRGMTQELSAIDASNGVILWTETVGAPIGDWSLAFSSSLGPIRLIVGDLDLVAVLGNGSLIGMDRATGDTLWEHHGFDPTNVYTDLAIDGSTVVASVYTRSNLGLQLDSFPDLHARSALLAFKIDDGTPLWAFDTGGIVSSVVVANGKAILKVFPTVLREQPDPQATPVGQFSETSFEIVGIDIVTGEVAWQGYGGDGDRGDLYLVPSADDGSVILVDNRSFTYSIIETETGNVGRSPLNFGQRIEGAPIADSERVYIQLKDGTLAAAALSVPEPQLSQDEIVDLLPDTGGPLPESVVWHVEQPIAWPPEAFGMLLGGMAVSDGHVYRTLISIDDLEGGSATTVLEAYDAQSGELLWQLPVDWMSGELASGDAIRAGDGSVFVIVNTSPETEGPVTSWELVAFDGSTGEQRWSYDVPDDGAMETSESIHAMEYANGVLYTSTWNTVITAYDAKTGDQLWQSEAPDGRIIGVPAQPVTAGSISEHSTSSNQGSTLSISVIGERVYVVRQDGQVSIFDVETGDILGLASPTSAESTTKPAFIGNLLFVGNTVWDEPDGAGVNVGKAGTLTAFDVTNNYAMVWEKEVGLTAENVVAIGDALFITTTLPNSDTGVIERIDPATGDVLWSNDDLGRYFYLSSTTGPDGSLAALSFFDGTFIVLDPGTGDVLSSSQNLPAVALKPGDNGLYFATLLDGTLVAISPNSWAVDQSQLLTVTVTAPPPTPEATATPDAIAWQIDGVGSEIYAGDLVVTGTTLIRATYTDAGGRIDAFDTQTGEPIWNKSLRWMGGLVLGDGLVYVPMLAENTVTGSIVALVPSTGEIVWEQLLDGRPIIPALVGDKLFVAADSGLMTALDAQSGEILWANHTSAEPITDYAGSPIPHAVGVSPNYVVSLYPGGQFVVFDARSGKVLYQLTGYYYANTRYAVWNNTLVVLASLPDDSATPAAAGIEGTSPIVLRGIDLENGDTLWDNAVLTRLDQPLALVASASGQDVSIQFVAEQYETQNGIFDQNGFLPGGTISAEPPSDLDLDLGTLFQIDPLTGEPSYVSLIATYSYGIPMSGPDTPDYTQLPVSINQQVIAQPMGDQNNIYLLLADGSVVAVKQEAIRGG